MTEKRLDPNIVLPHISCHKANAYSIWIILLDESLVDTGSEQQPEGTTPAITDVEVSRNFNSSHLISIFLA